MIVFKRKQAVYSHWVQILQYKLHLFKLINKNTVLLQTGNHSLINNTGINVICCAQAHIKKSFSCDRARSVRTSSISAHDKVPTTANYIDPCERICASCERNVPMRTALIFAHNKQNIFSWVHQLHTNFKQKGYQL